MTGDDDVTLTADAPGLGLPAAPIRAGVGVSLASPDTQLAEPSAVATLALVEACARMDSVFALIFSPLPSQCETPSLFILTSRNAAFTLGSPCSAMHVELPENLSSEASSRCVRGRWYGGRPRLSFHNCADASALSRNLVQKPFIRFTHFFLLSAVRLLSLLMVAIAFFCSCGE